MRRILAVTALLCCAMVASAQSAEKATISVLDFKVSGVSRAEADVFVDYITSHIVGIGQYRVIDRTQRDTVLQEIEFSYSGSSDERHQLEIGKLLAADMVVVGSLGRVGGQFILNIKTLDVQTGETSTSVSEVYASMDDLVNDSKRITYRVLDVPTPEGRSATKRAGSTPPAQREPGWNTVSVTSSYEFQDRDLYVNARYARLLSDFFGLEVGIGLGLQYSEWVFLGGVVFDLPRLRFAANAGYDTFAGPLFVPSVMIKFGRLGLVLEGGVSARFLLRAGAGLGVLL